MVTNIRKKDLPMMVKKVFGVLTDDVVVQDLFDVFQNGPIPHVDGIELAILELFRLVAVNLVGLSRDVFF